MCPLPPPPPTPPPCRHRNPCPVVAELQASCDIRGLEKLLEIASTPAFYACFYCWIRGFSLCRKTVYCGHHAMLPHDHPLWAAVAALNQDKRWQCTGAGQRDAYQHSELVPAARTQEQVQEGKVPPIVLA